MPQALSNRYAQALADAVFADKSGADPRAISGELQAFTNLVHTVHELKTVLLSPAVTTSRKRKAIQRIASEMPLSHLIRNFLFVLVDRRRADLLNEIAPAFDAAVDERLGLVRAEISSAASLSDAEKQDLEAALSQVAGRRVRCEFQVDAGLIGGVIARIGSTVYDGSVRSQLEAMRQTLVS